MANDADLVKVLKTMNLVDGETRDPYRRYGNWKVKGKKKKGHRHTGTKLRHFWKVLQKMCPNNDLVKDAPESPSPRWFNDFLYPPLRRVLKRLDLGPKHRRIRKDIDEGVGHCFAC